MYKDLSIYSRAAFQIAEIIESGYYTNVQYIEFHKLRNPKNPVFDSRELDSFRELSSDFYSNFISCSPPDEYETSIDTAILLGSQWYIIQNCGSNYYLGHGPQGIIKLRKACHLMGIPILVEEISIQDWLKAKFKVNPLDSVVTYSSIDKSNGDDLGQSL